MGSSTFLISPPRPTRIPSTANRSIAVMPSLPVSSPDQKVSRLSPIGVTAPAATMTIGSDFTVPAPDIEEVEPLLRVPRDDPFQCRDPVRERPMLGARFDLDGRADRDRV